MSMDYKEFEAGKMVTDMHHRRIGKLKRETGRNYNFRGYMYSPVERVALVEWEDGRTSEHNFLYLDILTPEVEALIRLKQLG